MRQYWQCSYRINNKDCFIGINSLLRLAIFIKGAIVIPICIVLTLCSHFRIIKTHQLEIIASVISIPSSGWFWYITSTYFSKGNDCKSTQKPIFYIHTILTIEALWFFFKLILIVLVLTIVIIALFVENYLKCRRAKDKSKTVKDKIMERESLNLTASKINPEEFCVICMEVYKPDDKVIRLPWAKTHFFHSKCLSEWIDHQPKCPLWNTEINPDMKCK